MSERSLSLIMLISIVFFGVAIILIPNKPANQAYANLTAGNRPIEQSSTTIGVTTYALPLAKTFNIPVGSSVTFKVRMALNTTLVGDLTEGGGSCFNFFSVDEVAYLFYLRNGLGWLKRLPKDQGEVYVIATPVHYKKQFAFVANRTGDYYFVLINPLGSYQDKTVSVTLNS